MSDDNPTVRVNLYLVRLRKALADVPSSERDEMVEEIRSHILERIEAEGPVTEQVVDKVLWAVGDPEELASEYKTEAMLRRAAGSKSPWLLLRTTLRWATTGIAGCIAFLITSVGYGCAAVCYLCGFLKPVFPAHVGLWLGARHPRPGLPSHSFLDNGSARDFGEATRLIRAGDPWSHGGTGSRTAGSLAIPRCFPVRITPGHSHDPVCAMVHQEVRTTKIVPSIGACRIYRFSTSGHARVSTLGAALCTNYG